jgi:hypothetical protein
MREKNFPASRAASADARALSAPLASISSVEREITSEASRPSTASTNARLTKPSLRSGPRYHIGNGAASIRCVSESNADSVCRMRRASLERSASAELVSESHNRTVPGASGGGAGPPRTSSTRLDPVILTCCSIGAPESAAARTADWRVSRSSRSKPDSPPARSIQRRTGPSSPNSRRSLSSISIDPSGRATRGRAGATSSRTAIDRAAATTEFASRIRRAARTSKAAAIASQRPAISNTSHAALPRSPIGPLNPAVARL